MMTHSIDPSPRGIENPCCGPADTPQPDDGEMLYQKALCALDRHNPEDAIRIMRIALQVAPHEPIYHGALGEMLLMQNDFPNAQVQFERALKLAPDCAEFHFCLGVAADGLDQKEQAVACYRQATALQPDWPEAWYNLGNALLHIESFNEAATALEQALHQRPDWSQAWLNLGVACHGAGLEEKAYNCWQKTIGIDPEHALAHYHCGIYFEKRKQLNEAELSFRRVIAMEPNNHVAHFKLAKVLRQQWRIDVAIVHCRRSFTIKPDYHQAAAFLAELAMHGCAWPLFSEIAAFLDRLTADQIQNHVRPSEYPLLSLWRHADPKRNHAVAAAYSRAVLEKRDALVQRPCFEHRPRPEGKPISIGYLSGDFRDHAVAFQIRGLLQAHDRRRFRIFGYATNPDNGTPYRRHLASGCDYFVPIDQMNAIEAAERIHADQIDILVDLAGHTEGNRPLVFAMRPAPVQVSYLGFLGTTGAAFIDYFITDKVATPDWHAPHYSEKLVFMPHCYQVNDHALAISDHPFSRNEFGLPDKAVVFCCFNQSHKIDPVTFDTWLQILRQVPHSVLWLLERNRTASDNLRSAARASGIDPARFIFSPMINLDIHLARLKLADLALDTFVYNGGATTANALWAGVPLVAMMGTHMVSRMSASALMAVGLPELIAQSPRDYCEKATALALDSRLRESFRTRLSINRPAAPLFNTQLFTRHLETAFTKMMGRFNDGLPPASIDLGYLSGT